MRTDHEVGCTRAQEEEEDESKPEEPGKTKVIITVVVGRFVQRVRVGMAHQFSHRWLMQLELQKDPQKSIKGELRPQDLPEHEVIPSAHSEVGAEVERT